MNDPKGFEKNIYIYQSWKEDETEWQMLRLKERVGGSSGEDTERGGERESEREVYEGMWESMGDGTDWVFQVSKRFEERNLRDLKQQKQTSLFSPHQPCQCSAKDGLLIDHKAWETGQKQKWLRLWRQRIIEVSHHYRYSKTAWLSDWIWNDGRDSCEAQSLAVQAGYKQIPPYLSVRFAKFKQHELGSLYDHTKLQLTLVIIPMFLRMEAVQGFCLLNVNWILKWNHVCVEDTLAINEMSDFDPENCHSGSFHSAQPLLGKPLF